MAKKKEVDLTAAKQVMDALVTLGLGTREVRNARRAVIALCHKATRAPVPRKTKARRKSR